MPPHWIFIITPCYYQDLLGNWGPGSHSRFGIWTQVFLSSEPEPLNTQLYQLTMFILLGSLLWCGPDQTTWGLGQGYTSCCRGTLPNARADLGEEAAWIIDVGVLQLMLILCQNESSVLHNTLTKTGYFSTGNAPLRVITSGSVRIGE